MTIEKHYPTRESLNQAEPFYSEALEVLNTLYMEAPAMGSGCLSSRDVIDYYMMSCAHTIVDRLTRGVASFPSVLLICKAKTYASMRGDHMDFSDFWVNADYKQTALFGIVYYVLAREQSVKQVYLDYIEKTFANDIRLKGYFQPFKDALKLHAEADAPRTAKPEGEQGKNELSALRKENSQLKKENSQLKEIVALHTEDPNYDPKKGHLPVRALALMVYMLANYEKKVNLFVNKSAWSNLWARMTTRNAQNIKEEFISINKDLSTDQMKQCCKRLSEEVRKLDTSFATFMEHLCDIDSNDDASPTEPSGSHS